jgi:hypothetical protein
MRSEVEVKQPCPGVPGMPEPGFGPPSWRLHSLRRATRSARPRAATVVMFGHQVMPCRSCRGPRRGPPLGGSRVTITAGSGCFSASGGVTFFAPSSASRASQRPTSSYGPAATPPPRSWSRHRRRGDSGPTAAGRCRSRRCWRKEHPPLRQRVQRHTGHHDRGGPWPAAARGGPTPSPAGSCCRRLEPSARSARVVGSWSARLAEQVRNGLDLGHLRRASGGRCGRR